MNSCFKLLGGIVILHKPHNAFLGILQMVILYILCYIRYKYITRKVKRVVSMYYLTITARRKNAKRHITDKSTSIAKLEDIAKNINRKLYKVEVHNGKWELVKEL